MKTLLVAWSMYRDLKKREQFKKMYVFYRTSAGLRFWPGSAAIMSFKAVRL